MPDNALTAARKQLAAALTTGGLRAYTTVPEDLLDLDPTRSEPPSAALYPMVYVAPGDPYLSFEGATFGGGLIRCSIVVIAPPDATDERAAELDTKLLEVLAALDANAPDWAVVQIDQPGNVNLAGRAHLAAAVTVLNEIRLAT